MQLPLSAPLFILCPSVRADSANFFIDELPWSDIITAYPLLCVSVHWARIPCNTLVSEYTVTKTDLRAENLPNARSCICRTLTHKTRNFFFAIGRSITMNNAPWKIRVQGRSKWLKLYRGQ